MAVEKKNKYFDQRSAQKKTKEDPKLKSQPQRSGKCIAAKTTDVGNGLRPKSPRQSCESTWVLESVQGLEDSSGKVTTVWRDSGARTAGEY